MLVALPELRETPRDRIDELATWLLAAYPSSEAFCVGLQPDNLAEQLIQDELLSDDEVSVAGLLELVDSVHVGRIADALARTHESQPESRAVIGGAVDTSLARLISAASESDEADAAIALLIARAATPRRAGLHAHHAHYSDRSTAAIIACSRHAVDWAGHFGGAGSEVFWTHAMRLRRSGLRREALRSVDEALAKLGHPTSHIEVLQVSRLISLRGILLAEIGQITEAIAAERAAIELLSGIVSRTSDDELRLSISHMNLGLWLSDAGEFDEALRVMLEGAVKQFDLLATAHPEGMGAMRDLLLSLGADVSGVIARGRDDDDLAPRRALLQHPLLHDPGPDVLMRLLTNLASILRFDDQPDRAVHAAGEAVRLGELWVASGAIPREQLAAALLQLGNQLDTVDQVADARAALERAVAVHRELVSDDPAHSEMLALSLSSLSLVVGRSPDGLQAALELSREAVNIMTELIAKELCHPGHYASVLSNRGVLLAEADQISEAMHCCQTALSEFRKLAVTSPRYAHSVRRDEANLETYRSMLPPSRDPGRGDND